MMAQVCAELEIAENQAREMAVLSVPGGQRVVVQWLERFFVAIFEHEPQLSKTNTTLNV